MPDTPESPLNLAVLRLGPPERSAHRPRGRSGPPQLLTAPPDATQPLTIGPSADPPQAATVAFVEGGLHNVVVVKKSGPTRAERREQEKSENCGIYGIDAQDAGADSWVGRYVFFARSRQEARQRIREARFHKKQIENEWTPRRPPPGDIPDALSRGEGSWYRRRYNDSGWTPWEKLSENYIHPPQSQAARDPSIRN
jgi:hypothetical protein